MYSTGSSSSASSSTTNLNMAAQNKVALDYFIRLPVSHDMVKYLAARASEVICCSATSQQMPLPTPPTTPPSAEAELPLPTVQQFITNLVQQSHVQVSTLMTSLVYLGRLKSRLPPQAQGLRCSVHRIFLAALILAAKNLNDSSPKNKHWARYTWVPGFEHFGFSTSEVNLMEKQLLFLLDWDMRVTENDLYHHLEPFLAPVRAWQIKQVEQQRAMLTAERQARERQLYMAHRRAVPASRNVYDSPASMASASTCDMRQVPVSIRSMSSHSRLPSRTPSLSPPSRSESSASSAYAESLASTPASSAYIDSYEAVSMQCYDAEMPTMIHMEAPVKSMSRPSHLLPYEIEEKPTKKARSNSGNIFTRFLSYNRQPAAY